MNDDNSSLAEAAQAIVVDMLSRFRALIASGHERNQQLTNELRNIERLLDEVAMQRTFAAERQLPSFDQIVERERTVRLSYSALMREAQSLQHALKQLDQLVRQIEMSSTTLAGTNEDDTSDPWMQALRAQVILGREEERVRLAREVHDNPAQVLANTLIGLEKSRSLLKEQRLELLTDLLDRLCGVTREGLQEVRNFIADLRPGRLDERGLVGALQEYITRYRDSHGASVQFEADHNLPTLTREAEIVFYRVVQESLQNVHKHARGSAVYITLTRRNNHLHLSVRDEGPGFDLREVARRAGRKNWGLTSMRERADMIGATYKVTSIQGQGTNVTIALPLE